MPQRYHVLITGASKGIGQATAFHLDGLGYHVLAGVRKQADADRLRETASDRLTPLIIDVTNTEQITAAAEQVAQITGDDGLYGLVNNAGVAVPGPLEVLPLDDLRWQLEVNVVGQMAVTQAMLPHIRRATGRIIMMSSVSGRWSFGLAGAYGVSKHGVEALANALRQELHPWGIQVVSILPGVIDTPIWETTATLAQQRIAAGAYASERMALYEDQLSGSEAMANAGKESGIPPERVAVAVQKALTATTPRTRYYVGADAHVLRTLVALLPPRWIDALLRRR